MNNNKTKLPTTTATKMESLRALLKQTTDSLVQAGKLIVEMIEEDQANYDRIKQEFGFSDYVMEKFQKVGLGRMNPTLVFDSRPVAHFVEKLPREVQDKVIEAGVPVVKTKDGGYDTQIVAYDKLSYHDAQTVFDKSRVRTTEEQIKKIEAKVTVLPPDPKPLPTIERVGDIITFREATFKLAELEAMVKRWKQEAIMELESSMRAKQVASA